MSTIPIILFHVGHQDYLFMCLRQALFFDNEVHLIGDNVDYFKKQIEHSKFHIVNFQSTMNFHESLDLYTNIFLQTHSTLN